MESDALIDRIAARLLPVPQPADKAAYREFGGNPVFNTDRPPVHAAVLLALVRRADGHHLLYTERSRDLRDHSGQVAFPGGKIDAKDHDAAEAAMREANEEVALRAADARVIGFLPNYFTGSNFRITPVVAEIRPTAPFTANPSEVAGLFEMPVDRLRSEEAWSRLTFIRGDIRRSTWRIDFQGHAIWGITAQLSRMFRDLVYPARGADDEAA